ncbi:MAG TPA: TIGR03435 family protein, partial [Bryobacteraceae bacterium]|nr:TIGR03435 family protein [Bryobacteraceae bacterium]
MRGIVLSAVMCCVLTAEPLRFEAAAIHPHDPKLRVSLMQFTKGGEVSIYGMTIRNLIWLAWKMRPERVSGGPKWLDSELYDIQAKAPQGSSNADSEQRARIQTLLADRLRLRVHTESKRETVYFLRVTKG